MYPSSGWLSSQSIACSSMLVAIVALLWMQSPCCAQNGSLFQDGAQGAAPAVPNQGYVPAPGLVPGSNPGLPPFAGPPFANSPFGGSPFGGSPFGGNPAYPAGPPSLPSSFTFQPPIPARVLRVNDIVSIRVEEIAQMIAQGNTTSRKTINFDAVLQDWIRMVGVDTIKPAPQSDGDPRARFNENEVYRGDSTMRLAEQLTFNIAARVADIQPNGNVVLEAKKTLEQSDNRFEASLSGICRAEDIGPNNVVLSRHIYDLKINRQDSGHVRDGYSRGWLSKWYARIKPF
jgi:flagellar L-ring protein precursor FlgH